jgi:hypothetical protein
VVKWSSWNVMLVDSLRLAFPGVPALFLYRDPVEVMVSVLRGPPGFLRERTSARARSLSGVEGGRLASMGAVEFAARCLGRMMEAALSSPGLDVLDHAELRPGLLPRLLERFGIDADPAALDAMRAQFAFDAKAFARDAPFVDDGAAKRRAAGPEVREAAARLLAAPYAALGASPRNLRPRRPTATAAQGGGRAG